MMVKYKGKKRLYEFLKTHGYDVPKMKDMDYSFYRNHESLGSSLLLDLRIDIYYFFDSDIISVMTYDLDEDGHVRIKDYHHYENGEVVYKTLYGKLVA